MDAQYVSKHAAICVSIKPEEVDEVIDLLREFIVEAEEKKLHIPVFANGFFEKLAFETGEVAIQFNFAYLEFCMNFLEKALLIIPKDENDIATLGMKLDQLWEDVAPYCVRDSTLH